MACLTSGLAIAKIEVKNLMVEVKKIGEKCENNKVKKRGVEIVYFSYIPLFLEVKNLIVGGE